MRRFLILATTAVLLAGCSTTELAYDLQMDVSDASDITELTLASTRVIERRLAALEATPKNLRFSTEGSVPRITLGVEDANTAGLLTQDLVAPFDLDIMQEAPEDEADIVVEGHGGFKATGVTEEDLLWAVATPEADGKGRVQLQFTEDGHAKIRTVFQENIGKNIGIVVRERLIAKIAVTGTLLPEDIVISGVPTIDLARVFADDVNTGLHVTFTPVP